MFHRFFKVVVHRPIDLSAFPVYSDAGELENVTSMILFYTAGHRLQPSI